MNNFFELWIFFCEFVSACFSLPRLIKCAREAHDFLVIPQSENPVAGIDKSPNDSASTGELPRNYFRVRDFEYAQPLYDLAYLLEVDAIAKGTEIPKYRTFALWRAAYSFDGYSTLIDRWLDGDIKDDSLDYVPSSRIRNYLNDVRSTGTITELDNYWTPAFRRALRLRAVRGLGLAQVASALSEEEIPSERWLSDAGANTNLAKQEILEVYQGSYGTWQAAHIIPPVARLLNAFEALGDRVCTVDSSLDGITPITKSFVVQVFSASLRDRVDSLLIRQPLFKLQSASSDGLVIRHQLGWYFRMQAVMKRCCFDLGAWARTVDPLLTKATPFKADLHLHTSWSDGNASLHSMASAVKDAGLEYFAVTDHSRSCKLQGGLTPILWLRQAASISLNSVTCPILHGIEVDILPNGSLDLPAGLLSGMDIVVASVHSNWTPDQHANTDRLIRAIETGLIDVIGHPTSAVIGKPGTPDYVRSAAKVNWQQIFEHCAKWRVAVELNCFPSRLDLNREMLKEAAEAGCWISVGSDAHSRSHLFHLKFGQAVLNGLEKSQILNSLTFNEIKGWLSEARRMRRTLSKTSFESAQPDLFAEIQVKPPRKLEAFLNPPQQIPEGSKIIGFDLTAGRGKPTGVALLDGMDVKTCSLESDEELMAFVVKNTPTIVSIDSPLGFPGGGTEIDPTAGIVRVAEHDLSSIGIPAYPALIDSMKELTVRGVRLRKMIEALESPPMVIESYPGAAQDVLCIPRKQKSLELLRGGLRELGLTGNGLLTESHDEMDAITSAVVGRFFEAGQFLPMGVASEAQLIVPRIKPIKFEKPPLICLAGRTGAGKSVVARYLALFYGFHWIKTQEVIRELLIEDSKMPPLQRKYNKRLSDSITDQDLRDFGVIILEKYHQEPLRTALCDTISKYNEPLVIDSIRDVSDLERKSLEERSVCIWFIEASDSIISNRLTEKAKIASFRGRPAMNPIDRKIGVLRDRCDYEIANIGTLEELRWRVDDVLFNLMSFRNLSHLPGS